VPYLIVTADDFGLTEGVCRGVLTAAGRGVVRSVSVMSRADRAGELARKFGPQAAALPGVRLGAHLQLTAGTPVLPPGRVPSLVAADGRFPKRPEAVVRPDPDEVYGEWRAQVAALTRMGLSPAYLDSHHHIHALPGVLPVFIRLARELGLPARAVDAKMALALREAGVACPDACLTGFFGASPSLDSLLAVVDAAFAGAGPEAVFELMTHPGRVDEELKSITSYAAPRELELAALAAPELPGLLAGRGITPASMADLPRLRGVKG
jgi:chitin disaccharide deacetylase